jgi:hypothetical protein
MSKFYISNCLFLPDKDELGNIKQLGLDGYGNPKTGITRPLWDWLVGLLNMETFPITARFRFWHEDTGQPVIWPDGLEYGDVTIQPGRTFAASLIPGNGFAHPPLDWQGHGTIETFQPSPFGPGDAPHTYCWCMASGGNWSGKDPSFDVPVRKTLPSQSSWVIPYVIPHFDDPNHAGPDSYLTGISIQNFSPWPVNVTVKYVIAQTYATSGQNWLVGKTLLGNGGARFDLGTELRAAGYEPKLIDGRVDLNSEGHLEIGSDSAAQLFPSFVVTTSDYLFGSGGSFGE